MISQENRIRGGMVGLLVGDAVGVPYEFHTPDLIPTEIDMFPPVGFNRAHKSVSPGTWSDDGAQALVLLDSLLENGGLDVDMFGAGLVDWLDAGFMAVNKRVFDVGAGTVKALDRIATGTRAIRAGNSDKNSNGNGSLMRVLPLALWCKGDDTELVNLAALQSGVTHAHGISKVCCALYCLWARYTLLGDANPWNRSIYALQTIFDAHSGAQRVLDSVVNWNSSINGTGYVVDCLHSARWAVQGASSYENVIKRSISLGHDTDTTACVAGGIAGIKYGIGGIPERWKDAMQGMDIANDLIAKLLRWRSIE